MKPYTKVYMSHFGYGEQDFVPCECCGAKAVDIHHIFSRKRRPDLFKDIKNLMALCRNCHVKYGDKNNWLDFLQEIHNKVLSLFAKTDVTK